jgi:hypothetical protein
MAQWRRETDRMVWHWCANCSGYPQADFEMVVNTPTHGSSCLECSGHDRVGTCRQPTTLGSRDGPLATGSVAIVAADGHG